MVNHTTEIAELTKIRAPAIDERANATDGFLKFSKTVNLQNSNNYSASQRY
jgi:hypothetical protein